MAELTYASPLPREAMPEGGKDADGVVIPAPPQWCPECRSAGVVGIEQDVCPTCDGTGKVAAGVPGTFNDQQEKKR